MSITLETWVENFDKGMYSAKDVNTQCDAGWYDWFCRETSLANKTKELAPKVKMVAKSSKINVKTSYVFFKNNCPCEGSLYDDFRICDMESGDVIYTIVPASGYKSDKGISQVWGRENEFAEPLVEGSWKDVKAFFA